MTPSSPTEWKPSSTAAAKRPTIYSPDYTSLCLSAETTRFIQLHVTCLVYTKHVSCFEKSRFQGNQALKLSLVAFVFFQQFSALELYIDFEFLKVSHFHIIQIK